ncbi:MAG: nicotinamide-nucleotide amidohydrolase family protein [Lewinella sp.]|nr:nicotinamide-nucleotide amidohydrolase family protein [Lewinella sp.]
MAYLPNLGFVRVRVSGSGPDAGQLQAEIEGQANRIREQLGDLVYGQDDELLEAVIGNLLREHQLTISTAESCTGGFVAHLITSIAGSSDYFKGSIVAYANEIKEAVLGVRPETLMTHGAVSEATVREMVNGALRVMKTDLAIAISGIAGPGGGTPEKPVGTIWMAVGNGEETETFKLQAGKDRSKNIEYASNYALNFVRKFVLKHYATVKV